MDVLVILAVIALIAGGIYLAKRRKDAPSTGGGSRPFDPGRTHEK